MVFEGAGLRRVELDRGRVRIIHGLHEECSILGETFGISGVLPAQNARDNL